jgi:hypothetical protein
MKQTLAFFDPWFAENEKKIILSQWSAYMERTTTVLWHK